MQFDPLAIAQSVLDAGGWTVVIALVVVVGLSVYRGKLVLDWVYQQKVDEVKALTIAVAKLTAELARERRRKDPPSGPG